MTPLPPHNDDSAPSAVVIIVRKQALRAGGGSGAAESSRNNFPARGVAMQVENRCVVQYFGEWAVFSTAALE